MEQNSFEILTDDERRKVEDTPETGFITDFEKWAAMQTDAPSYTLKAAALQALSLAAGDTTAAQNFFGAEPVYLNLYTLVVGPSTTMRKTTVLNFVKGLLPTNQQTHDDYIHWLDDVSIQAFNNEVAAAGKLMAPVILSTDEVAGLFSQMKNQGHYLASFDKNLLKVYDHSPIRITRVNKTIDSEKGCFVNFFGVSTPEPILEVLDSNDVASGLLPRLIVFDARHAVRGERRSLHDRAKKDEWLQMGEQLKRHLYRIAKPRADGVPTGADIDGNPIFPVTVMEMSKQALDRLDRLDAQFSLDAMSDTSALGAIKGRAFTHVQKLSHIYALSRGGAGTTVELIDVLRACWLIETTIGDLLTMVDEVGANALERSITEVTSMLSASRGKTARQSTIANKMKLSSREVRELVATLVVRDLIAIENKNNEVLWRLK